MSSFLFSLFLRLILFASYFYCVTSKLLGVSSALLCFLTDAFYSYT